MKPLIRTPLPGPNARKTISVMKRFAVNSTFEYPSAIKDGEGCWLQDTDGNRFLDFNSNICTQPLGYAHPDLMEVLREKSKLGAYKIGGQDFYCEEHAELVRKLIGICPAPLRKAFLVNTGAEAVENAMKFAYRRRGPLAGVSCHNAFHGRTLGALSYTHSKAVQKKNCPSLPHHIIGFCARDDDKEIGELEKLIAEAGEPAFVIVEAVQGEGGYVPASRKFIRELRRIAREHGVPLIFDEVQCGMGRTGKWWGFENYGVVPEIMACGKALQVGAAVTSREYAPPEKGAVSSTWGGGHRIDMAVGARMIEVIKRDKLMISAKRMGAYLMKRLEEIAEAHDILTEVRGLGLMIGAEIKNKEARDFLLNDCFRSGLFLLGCGVKSVRFAPPLIITEEEADMGLGIFEDSVKKLAACKRLPENWRPKICPTGVPI